MRLVVATLLTLEGLVTGLWIAGRLPTLAVYDAVALVLLLARAMTGALLFTAGWMLHARRPAAAPLGVAALMVSAGLAVLEIGLRLAPSNIDPSWRWRFVAAYAVYAAVAMLVIRRSA